MIVQLSVRYQTSQAPTTVSTSKASQFWPAAFTATSQVLAASAPTLTCRLKAIQTLASHQ